MPVCPLLSMQITEAAPIQGKDIWLHVLMEGLSRNFHFFSKTTTVNSDSLSSSWSFNCVYNPTALTLTPCSVIAVKQNVASLMHQTLQSNNTFANFYVVANYSLKRIYLEKQLSVRTRDSEVRCWLLNKEKLCTITFFHWTQQVSRKWQLYV